MRVVIRTAVVLLLSVSCMAYVGCGAAEDAKENMKDAAGEMKEGMEDAAGEMKKGMEDGVEKMKEAASGAKEEAGSDSK